VQLQHRRHDHAINVTARVVLVLASLLGASAPAGFKFNTVELWKASKGGGGGGEQSGPAPIRPGRSALRAPAAAKKMSRSDGTGLLQFFVSARITR
jgi:hypothetical protein